MIKAKLKAIEGVVTSLENEFLSQILLADGSRFCETATTKLEDAVISKLPKVLNA